MPSLQHSQCQAGWTDAKISDLSSPLKKKKIGWDSSTEQMCHGSGSVLGSLLRKSHGGTLHCFSIFKKGEKTRGSQAHLNHGASGFKTVLTQTYRNCLSWTAAECKNNALNIFMRCRFYSTCVEFCSANGDYNSKLILRTPEMKQSVCESLCCSSRASWRTKHEWLSSLLCPLSSLLYSPCSYWRCIDFIVSVACKHALQAGILGSDYLWMNWLMAQQLD